VLPEDPPFGIDDSQSGNGNSDRWSNSSEDANQSGKPDTPLAQEVNSSDEELVDSPGDDKPDNYRRRNTPGDFEKIWLFPVMFDQVPISVMTGEA